MHRFFVDNVHPSLRLVSPHKRVTLLVFLVICLILSVSGQAVLATRHNQPINGCYDATSRVLRYIDTGTCRNSEVALSWPSMDDFVALQAALAQETSEREAAISALESAVAALQASMYEEIAALQRADAALGAALATEAAAREASDTALNDAVTALHADLGAETTARVDGDAATLSAANAYTDDKFSASIEHTNTAVAKEADVRALLDVRLSEKIAKIIDELLPQLGVAIGNVQSLLSQKIDLVSTNLQANIDRSISIFNAAIKDIQDWIDWLWCSFFSDDC